LPDQADVQNTPTLIFTRVDPADPAGDPDRRRDRRSTGFRRPEADDGIDDTFVPACHQSPVLSLDMMKGDPPAAAMYGATMCVSTLQLWTIAGPRIRARARLPMSQPAEPSRPPLPIDTLAPAARRLSDISEELRPGDLAAAQT
jgi:hypothetical protein